MSEVDLIESIIFDGENRGLGSGLTPREYAQLLARRIMHGLESYRDTCVRLSLIEQRSQMGTR